MKYRAGDRRAYPRFEIVGTLVGSLETWRRVAVRNIGLDGALIETSESFAPTTTLRGRLTFRGRRVDIRSEVRHVTRDYSAREMGYVVGLQFAERLAHFDDLLIDMPAPEAVTVRSLPDRRCAPRIECSGEASLDLPVSATVILEDISLGGLMFSSPRDINPGALAHIRVRLGHGGFAADVEARRSEPARGPDVARRRIGAAFLSMNDESRQTLAAFLATAAV